MPTDLPYDWRARMTAMISGQEPLDDAMFAGGPALTPLQQIGVYRRQYQLRMYDALADEVLGLKHLLGDDARKVLWAFLDAHPSRSWTLNRIADGFVDWLEEQSAPVEQIEMAKVDRGVQRGFEARNGTPITPEALAGLPRLRLQPAVSLLKLTTNVHLIRGAALQKAEIPPLKHGLDVHLVLFRKDHKMRHWELNPPAWVVLEGLSEGLELMEAITAVVERGMVAPDALATEVQGWFKDFAQHQLVEVAG
ncbi:MAG: DNA-binding domain-containing protein [Myxococcota bacterium]